MTEVLIVWSFKYSPLEEEIFFFKGGLASNQGSAKMLTFLLLRWENKQSVSSGGRRRGISSLLKEAFSYF